VTKLSLRRLIAIGIVLAATVASGPNAAIARDRTPERFQPVQTTVTVPAGGRATVGIRVRRPGGRFTRHRFQFARVPRGLRISWDRETPNGDLTLVIRAARNLSPGTRRVRLRYSGGVTANVRVVTPARRPTFAVAVEPSIVEAPLGEERELRVAVRRVDGFAEAIELSVDAPDDVAAELDPETIGAGATSAVLRLSGSVAGTHQVTLTAEGGGQRRQAVLTFRAIAPALPPALAPALAQFVLEPNEVRLIPIKLIAGQTALVRAIVQIGDVDLSVFDDASNARVLLSAENGTATEEAALTGPGDFTVELRAVVASTVRVETTEP
jgi:hypothetical protein